MIPIKSINAVIFSASKDGAAYNAAVGSRLLIDDVTIVNE